MDNRVWYNINTGFDSLNNYKTGFESLNNYKTQSNVNLTDNISSNVDSNVQKSNVQKDNTEEDNPKANSSVYENMTLFIIAVAIVVIGILIYLFVKNLKVNGEDYNQRQAHHYFTRLNGEITDENSVNAIKYGESIKEPTAIDHYRLGTTYLVNNKEHIPAAFHFNKALEKISNGEASNTDATFIIERIDDYKSHFIDHSDIPELPVQEAILSYYKNLKKTNDELKKKNSVDKVSVPKLILNKQKWHSDSQNVHDTAVFSELLEQYNMIVNSNKKIKEYNKYMYQDAIKYIKNKFKDTKHLGSVDKVINILSNNYEISFMPGVKEQDIITAIWQRSYDDSNIENAEEIRDALCYSILDCIEGDSVVCMAGRVPKLWQALATLDKERGIGTIKSKQVLRNEIYQRCAKIVHDKLGPSGSASDEVKNAYNNGRDIIGVKECIESIYKEMDNIKTDYKDLISDDIIQLYINECKNVL